MYDYKNKQRNIRSMNDYMLARTLIMFEYEGLPETIPAKAFETQLQRHGFSFVTEVKGKLYCFTGGLGGELNEYYEPTQIVIANPWLKFNETLDLEKDGVLCANDEQRQGLLPLFDKYHTLLVENDITMILNSYNNRVQTMISAGDDATRESAELYLQKVKDGDQGVIAEQRIFDGISVHNAHSNIASNTVALTEFHQYLKATLYNEIGLDANFNMKRERLTAGEVQQNDEGLYPLVTNMLYNRRKAVNEINEKYGTEITVTFGSVWKNRNLDGELNQDLQLGHTEDMEAGQTELEQQMLLEQLLGWNMYEQPAEQYQEEQPAQIELPAMEEQAMAEPAPEPAEPTGLVLSEKALNTDIDDLPAEERLEIYDLIFGIEDEEADIDEVAERIADILENAENEEAGADEDSKEEPEETEATESEPTEQAKESQEEEDEEQAEEETEETEQLAEPEPESIEEPETEELQEEITEDTTVPVEEPEEVPEIVEEVAEEVATEEPTEDLIEPIEEPIEEEVAEIIAEAVEEVIEIVEEEETEEEETEEEEGN